MLSMIVDPGKFGQNLHLDWHDGEPVPEVLSAAAVVQFTADGHELALIVHTMNGDMEYMHQRLQGTASAPSPLPGAEARPRFVQLIHGQDKSLTALFALDEQGRAWSLTWIRDEEKATPRGLVGTGRFVWQPLNEFEL